MTLIGEPSLGAPRGAQEAKAVKRGTMTGLVAPSILEYFASTFLNDLTPKSHEILMFVSGLQKFAKQCSENKKLDCTIDLSDR